MVQLMHLQVASPSKGFNARLATKLLPLPMEQLMQFQMASRGIEFPAVVADMCLLPAVD